MADFTDPTHATSSALNRRAFVGLSAGATAYASTIAGALAAGEDFGKPHAPVVAENDPTLAIARPHIRYGTRTIDSYYAAPKNAGPTTPAIVVVQHIWGVDAQIRDTVRRLAREGYIAIAPDLYTGLGAPNGDGLTDYKVFLPTAQKLADATVDADIVAASNFIRSGAGHRPQRVGVMGFCMGGSIALRQTVDSANLFSAAAVFYGKVRYDGSGNNEGPVTLMGLSYADEVATPLLGSYGARDTSILAADVATLSARLGELKKPRDIKVYDEAGHGFFDDTRSSYVASAAADAWTRTLLWFATYLK
ncbi:MAG: dienelactone hydrolase family protein [Vulcanimicrobiaceae bacterium]